MARLYERNDNLIQTLTDPKLALENVQTDLYNLTGEMGNKYNKLLNEFRDLGFSEDECTARADVMIGREMETALAVMQIKNPYAMGGAEAGGWDPVSGLLRANPIAQNAPRTFAAIQQSGGLGLAPGAGGGGGGKISKAEKKRLRKKWKRQRAKKGQ
jgi:hypothetical protein